MTLTLHRPNADAISRWTPGRKREVLLRYCYADEAARQALLAEHQITADEIDQWDGAYQRHGLAGLKVTKRAFR